MKAEIHPAYNQVKAVCSCGNELTIGSTLKEDLHLDICSKCHPFYTGKQKVMDTAGRIEKFNAKYAKKAAKNDGK